MIINKIEKFFRCSGILLILCAGFIVTYGYHPTLSVVLAPVLLLTYFYQNVATNMERKRKLAEKLLMEERAARTVPVETVDRAAAFSKKRPEAEPQAAKQVKEKEPKEPKPDIFDKAADVILLKLDERKEKQVQKQRTNIEEITYRDAPAILLTDDMTGVEFEVFCMELLNLCGFSDVSQTVASGDNGVDILAKRGGESYAFQCKCYSGHVPRSAVQEVFTGKAFYECDNAVVMTNSYFTESAVVTAKKTQVQLWNRKNLMQLLAVCGDRDWSMFRHQRLEVS